MNSKKDVLIVVIAIVLTIVAVNFVMKNQKDKPVPVSELVIPEPAEVNVELPDNFDSGMDLQQEDSELLKKN